MSGAILLIDDEPMMGQLYHRALSARGYTLFTVTSGEDAFEIIHGERPELVISDIMMPGISGYELCDKLVRANEKRMPFLFLSANDAFSTLCDGLTAGGDDFLVKGVDLNFLEDRVRFWLKTPFSGLPAEPRRAAIAEAASALERIHAKPIESLGAMREDLKSAALALAHAAIFNAGADYLARSEPPVSFLGFLAGAIETLAKGDVAAMVRFPDYYDAVLTTLAPAWAIKTRSLFTDYDAIAATDLFRAAHRSGVAAATQHRI